MAEAAWESVFATARSIAPAEQWRRELATAIRDQTRAVFVAVCTCAPGLFLLPSATAVPAAFGRVVDQIIDEFLPRIERSGDGTALTRRIGPGAYAPLELAQDLALANRFRRELLTPLGIDGLVNTFLLSTSNDVLGWIAVGTREPAREAIDRFGPQLTSVSSIAARTLESVLEMAAACGGRPRPARIEGFEMLTPREREVAKLVARGRADSAIAAELEVSEETVGTHLRRIYGKLGIHSRGELVAELAAIFRSLAR